MKEQELLFLGLLQDGPKHGYQLKKLSQEISSTFAGLKTDSIYYPLHKMLREGLLVQKKAKEGKRPAKYVYKLTERGKEEFKKLLLKNILTIERPYFSIDLALYFLHYIPEGLKEKSLKIRIKLLNRIKKRMLKFKQTFTPKSSSHLIAILDHNQQLLDAEIGFISHLIR